MGCNGYSIVFFYRAVFPTGKDSSHRNSQLGRNKQDKPHPKGWTLGKNNTKNHIP